MQLIEAFRDEGWQVQVCSPCLPNPHRDRLEAQGIATAHFEPNDSRFDAFVRELQPELVIFDRFMIEEQFSWRVREQCPEALRVLDTCDLHSLRRLRQQKTAKGQSALVLEDGELQTDDLLRELSSIYRSDLSLVVSDFELAWLRERFGLPEELVELCRIFYPEPRAGLGFAERRDFAIIGNFRHAPNLDAYRLLQRELWQKIRSRLAGPDARAELHVFGAYPTKELMDLDCAETGFRVKGWAPDARETLGRYRINLAPLRFGAGIKGKILDGWAAGTPCVATAVGAEGLHEGLPFGGAIPQAEGDWDAFAASAAALYSDFSRWERARQDGMEILKLRFGQRAVTEALSARLRRLVAEKHKMRERNFVGAMLWHHGARSTEYFSRWIELKRQDRPRIVPDPSRQNRDLLS